jgi:hypothetical protein
MTVHFDAPEFLPASGPTWRGYEPARAYRPIVGDAATEQSGHHLKAINS